MVTIGLFFFKLIWSTVCIWLSTKVSLRVVACTSANYSETYTMQAYNRIVLCLPSSSLAGYVVASIISGSDSEPKQVTSLSPTQIQLGVSSMHAMLQVKDEEVW